HNITWAVDLLRPMHIVGNREWADICVAIHAEARSAGVHVSVEDQSQLANLLVSVNAVDLGAAKVFEELAREWPLLLRPEHCWLYCRAAQQHGYRGASDLDLFARTFADAEPARSFYRAHDWDFDEVEYTYLERAATHQPGRFPEVLGPEYVARGESFLLQRS